MAIMGSLTVDPMPPITTQGITRSGVIGVMWKMAMNIMTPSKRMWRKNLSLSGVLLGCSGYHSGGFGRVLRESCGFTGL